MLSIIIITFIFTLIRVGIRRREIQCSNFSLLIRYPWERGCGNGILSRNSFSRIFVSVEYEYMLRLFKKKRGNETQELFIEMHSMIQDYD